MRKTDKIVFKSHSFTHKLFTLYSMKMCKKKQSLMIYERLVKILHTYTSTLHIDIYIIHKDSRSYNLFVFAYRLFHEDFSSINGALIEELYIIYASYTCQYIKTKKSTEL